MKWGYDDHHAPTQTNTHIYIKFFNFQINCVCPLWKSGAHTFIYIYIYLCVICGEILKFKYDDLPI